MGKWAHDDVLDAPLHYLAVCSTHMCVCPAQPADYEQAMREALLTAEINESFFSIRPGDCPGRKMIVRSPEPLKVANRGIANHIALVDSITQKLLYVTTCNAMLLVYGRHVVVTAWEIEFAAPGAGCESCPPSCSISVSQS
jgi:hypothetical protein